MDFLPTIGHSMCLNRKFEDESELELAVEYKMLQVQLTNALWHRTSPPTNPLFSSGFAQLPQSSYKPLGFRNCDNDDDEEDEEDDDEADDDGEPEEEDDGEPVEPPGDVDMTGPADELMDDSDEFS